MSIEKEYQAKIRTADEAFSLVRSNQHVVTAMAAAEPTCFFKLLSAQAKRFEKLVIHCANPMHSYSCFFEDDLEKHLRLNTMFLTSALGKGPLPSHVQYIPQHLSKWSQNIRGTIPVDIFWGSCTPPDADGYVSLGVSCCYESEIIAHAKLIILEVNEKMPYTYGATRIPLSQVHHFIENTHDLPLCENAATNEIDEIIAGLVSEMVHDGSTIQLGIGAIPNALGERLKTKKNLSVHTELITDSIVTLFQSGVLTGSHKGIWPDKIVGSFVFGTQRLYDFVHKNPRVELHPSSIVNNPFVIAKNKNMVSINSAIEIDLTGQVCSESIGHREISGAGGATDTHVGAQLAQNGRGIIALHASVKNRSKIVGMLTPGAKVTVSRNDVDTIVTEYGIAHLKGMSVRDRVKSLIAIAHPQFREELLSDAKKYGYV